MIRFGRDQPDIAVGHVLADRLVRMAVWVARQQHGVRVLRAARHRVAGEDILGNRLAEEALGRDDLDLAAAHVGFIDHAAHTAEVVDVRVRIDDTQHRPLAELLVDEFERRAGGFLGGQRIEDDPAGIALDEADVGQVIAAHLVDPARHDLVEPVGHVQYGLALQRRVDALEVLALQQPLVAGHVPGDVAGIGHDLLVGRLGDEAFLGLVEVTLVLERQGGGDTLAQFDGVLRRQGAFRVEVLA